MSSEPTPDISIIVPCYNQGRYLAETLQSVISQTHSNWECVIVDDGSSDQTAEVARSFTARDRRFRYVHQANAGVSAARNLGVRLSRGRYLLPLDGDDRIGPGYVAAICAVLDQDPEVVIVYCHAESFGERRGPWPLPEYSLKAILVENCIFCTAGLRRTTFDQAGGFREAMRHGYEDWDFWLSVLSHGGKVVRLPETYFYYRYTHNSRNRSMTARHYAEMRAEIYSRHWRLYLDHYPDPIEMIKKIQYMEWERRSLRTTPGLLVRSFYQYIKARLPRFGL